MTSVFGGTRYDHNGYLVNEKGFPTNPRLPPPTEKRKNLSEFSLQQGAPPPLEGKLPTYWVGKTLLDGQACLIFRDGSYKTFGENNLPDLPGRARIHRLSYSDGDIDERALIDKGIVKYDERYTNDQLREYAAAYTQNNVVAFFESALKFRAKMETDKSYANHPARQKIKDFMDLIVQNNQKNLDKLGSAKLSSICVIL